MISRATPILTASETYLRSRWDLEEPTKAGYRKTFTRFGRLNPTLGDLTAENVNDFLGGEEHAPTMARNDCIALRGMGKWAAKVGCFTRNPLESVELPRGRGGTREPFKDKDVVPIIKAAERSALGFRDKALIVVGLSCAIRPGELWQLDLSDVDTRAGWVTVRRETTKTTAGARTIPLDPQAVAVLEDYLAMRPNVDGPLWLNNRGRPFKHGGFMAIFARLRLRLAQEGITFTAYQMRHTAITNWVRADVETPIVQQLAGHRSIVTTQRYIGRLGRDDLARIPRAFSKIYGKAV